MPSGVTVIAYIYAKTGHQDEVRRALFDLAAQTRAEKGCINYDVHQSLESTTRFAIYENWISSADLDAHAKAAALRNFTRIAGPLLERPAKISKWIMVSEPMEKP